MRTVYTTDERSHVSGGAGTGDEDEAALKAFPAENVFAEKVARLRHNRLCCQNNDMQRRHQARQTGALVADVHADGTGAGHASESLGYTHRSTHPFFRCRINHDTRIANQIGEQFGGKVLGRSEQNPTCSAGYPENCVEKTLWRAVDDLDGRHGSLRGTFELLDYGLGYRYLHSILSVQNGGMLASKLSARV